MKLYCLPQKSCEIKNISLFYNLVATGIYTLKVVASPLLLAATGIYTLKVVAICCIPSSNKMIRIARLWDDASIIFFSIRL